MQWLLSCDSIVVRFDEKYSYFILKLCSYIILISNDHKYIDVFV